ncbi:hypothetical protein LTR56_000115 [Elasticomyces elasticus]|nr:hypothetical protein LTR56_000115 [Elasticomyces elasticus]KAK3667103.1 hypothetical protein LTR22_001967 [Elasticomyces elasticus]KAK4932878.1 hypothetical protein LTR49_000834 [Elasticomyces elasticus]KAK5768718.1 hypothetical protein LTS12_001144 [Elasticomyces elasticus]
MADTEAGTTVNETFPLFKLRPEFWLRIGKYVLGQTRKVLYQYSRASNKVWQKRTRQPAITRTCQALRAELLPIFYKQYVSCIFAWEHHINWKGRATWLHAIGAANRRSLSDVRLITRSDMVDEELFELKRKLPSLTVGDEPRKHDERERDVGYPLGSAEVLTTVYSLEFT